MEKTILSEKIRNLADSNGIDALGFAEASEFKDYVLNRSKRRDPKLSLPDAKTIIVVGIYIGGIVLPAWNKSCFGRTSRLYLSGFFLDVVKPLEPIAMFLRNEGYSAIVCDDSVSGGSIIPLKLAAVRAGLGWQGKHSLLINKKYGTFLALGGIVTNAIIEHNEVEEKNRCTNCEKCQRACPCEALEQPYILNRKRCLSIPKIGASTGLSQHRPLSQHSITLVVQPGSTRHSLFKARLSKISHPGCYRVCCHSLAQAPDRLQVAVVQLCQEKGDKLFSEPLGMTCALQVSVVAKATVLTHLGPNFVNLIGRVQAYSVVNFLVLCFSCYTLVSHNHTSRVWLWLDRRRCVQHPRRSL